MFHSVVANRRQPILYKIGGFLSFVGQEGKVRGPQVGEFNPCELIEQKIRQQAHQSHQG